MKRFWRNFGDPILVLIGLAVLACVWLWLTGCSLHLGEQHYHYNSPETAAAHASPTALIDKIFSSAGDEPTPEEN